MIIRQKVEKETNKFANHIMNKEKIYINKYSLCII